MKPKTTEQLVRKCFCNGCKVYDETVCFTCVAHDRKKCAHAARAFVKAENKQKETDKIPSYTYKVYSRKDMDKIAQFAKANRLRMIREGIDFPGKNLIIKMRSKRKGK